MGRGNGRGGGGRGNQRRGGGGGRGGRGGAQSEQPPQQQADQPQQQQPQHQQQPQQQQPVAVEEGMGWTRRNRFAKAQAAQAAQAEAAQAQAAPQAAVQGAPQAANNGNHRGGRNGRGGRGGNGGRGGGGANDEAHPPQQKQQRRKNNKQKKAAEAPGTDEAPADSAQPDAAELKKGKGGSRRNRNRGGKKAPGDAPNPKPQKAAPAPKADLPAIPHPAPRAKDKAVPAEAAAPTEGYDRTSGKQGKRRVRPPPKPKKHVDPFAGGAAAGGEHTHTHESEPVNIHGHALLEGDVEQDDAGSDGLPAALRSGASSSAMAEEEEEEQEDHGATSDDDDGSANGTDEDFSDTANERQKEYREGGYHPVYIGEVYNERYRVVHKLGWGYFSTVWLVWDYKGHSFHAMKVQKSAQHYRDAAYDEIKLLTQIMGADPTREHACARMTDSFEHIGPHGVHVVMIFDVLGENLLKLMERYEYKGIPIPIVKAIAKQTLIGLRHIHSIEIIHTDLKPENVLLQTPKHSIVNIMKRYHAPPVSENLSLLERDRSMMTKSQRRRYDAKVRKLRRDAAEKGRDSAQPGSDSDSEEAPASKGPAVVDPSRAAQRSADGGGIPTDDLSAEVSAGVKAAEAAVNAEDSETDPEWEVQRFQNVCLADFGNSCWTYKQFADEVQTRQYRCPEVMIGDPYGTAIDMWSAACMFFELLTGEFLFDPKESGEYPRDEDHLALVMELLGPLPAHMAMGRGKFRATFFNSRGELRHIKDLRFWGLRDVLHKKYRFSRKKANEIADFLLPMLTLDPRERATAAEMLEEFADFFDPVDDDFAPACFSTGESDDEAGEDEARGPQPFSCRQPPIDGESDEEEEEEDIEAWLANHPLLHPDQLASMGLKLEDVTTVLQGGTLPDPKKQQVVDMIIERMQDDMAPDDDEGDAAAAADDDDDDEEEDQEDEEGAESSGSEGDAETPAAAKDDVDAGGEPTAEAAQ